MRAVVFDWWGTLWTPGESEISEEAISLILHLYKSNFRLAILSNTDNHSDARWLRRKLAEKEILDCFEVVYTSAAYGVAKPDPEAFYLVARFLQVQPHQILMVGDSESTDGGAVSAGWKFKKVETGASVQWAPVLNLSVS